MGIQSANLPDFFRRLATEMSRWMDGCLLACLPLWLAGWLWLTSGILIRNSVIKTSLSSKSAAFRHPLPPTHPSSSPPPTDRGQESPLVHDPLPCRRCVAQPASVPFFCSPWTWIRVVGYSGWNGIGTRTLKKSSWLASNEMSTCFNYKWAPENVCDPSDSLSITLQDS